MSANDPFSLRIFVADGDPDGLRIVERSNWVGKALMFPRTIFPSIKQREEFSQAAVYLLLGTRDDGDGEQIYIGETDSVGERLKNHYANKDFWNRAVFFISSGSSPLNKAHVQFLEARLYALAKQAKRLPLILENGNQPKEPNLSEFDSADMKVFLKYLLGILPVLGIYAFEQPNRSTSQNQPATLKLEAKGIKASGYESSQGFIVLKDSHALADEQPSIPRGFKEIRDELITSGVLKRENNTLVFTQDSSFSSPSTAAGVVLGRNANGRTEWKDEHGRTLKEIQEAAIKS
jgi:hypothetical protein